MRFLVYFCLLGRLFWGELAAAQTVLRFEAYFGEEKLELGRFYKISERDSVAVEVLRFYLADLKLLGANKTLFEDAVKAHLIDWEVPGSCLIDLKKPFAASELKGLGFNLGIDSLTNVSGALGGDLDPTTGMYWTWQSGYINFKLEGVSNLSAARKNQFHLHLGGYATPYNAMRRVQLLAPPKAAAEASANKGGHWVLRMDLKSFIIACDLRKNHSIMSPSATANQLAEIVSKKFVLINEK
jgi:hypothetical protein